jgi:fluoride ion exporter CrcB/FEX
MMLLDALMIIAGGAIGCALAAIAAQAFISQSESGDLVMHPSPRVCLDRLILLGGCGGLTTVSSLAVEMAEVAQESPLRAAALGAVNMVAGCVAVAGGRWLVRQVYSIRERLEHEVEVAVR